MLYYENIIYYIYYILYIIYNIIIYIWVCDRRDSFFCLPPFNEHRSYIITRYGSIKAAPVLSWRALS